MNANKLYVIPLALAIGAGPSMAQTQPATIPTAVAQAMTFYPDFFGRPQFFDAQTPPEWPAALTPSSARILGGGMIGDSSMYRMRVAVFEFPAQSNPRAALEALVTRAGFAPLVSGAIHPKRGGFAETPAMTPEGKYCKGSILATFGAADSVHTPRVFSVMLLDGEAGRQNCSRETMEAMDHRFPVTVPPMSAPAGVAAFGGGSGWSGSSGSMSSRLRTTMPTDSLLAHYTAQLVAGGWKVEGRPANGDGIGLQRFTFHEGQDPWTGALIIMAAGDRREVILQLARSE